MFTVTFLYTAGKTNIYAYPASASYSLSSTPWNSHRVLATELVAGLYSVAVDEAKSPVWSVFDGNAVPTTHDDAITTIRYDEESVAISAIRAKTDNLPSDPADQSVLMTAINAIPTSTDPNNHLLDVWRRLGLDPANPLVNTVTSISAGSVLVVTVTQNSTSVTTTRQT